MSLPIKSEPKVKQKVPKLFDDISDEAFISAIESSIRIPIPDFGIHRPLSWVKGTKCGVVYKVIANICKSKMKTLSASNNGSDVVKLKWKLSRGRIRPESGYEEFISIIPDVYIKNLVKH